MECFGNYFPASRGPFSFVFPELRLKTKEKGPLLAGKAIIQTTEYDAIWDLQILSLTGFAVSMRAKSEAEALRSRILGGRAGSQRKPRIENTDEHYGGSGLPQNTDLNVSASITVQMKC